MATDAYISWLALFAAATIGCSEGDPPASRVQNSTNVGARPRQTADISDLAEPAADLLRKLPGVADVETVTVDNTTHRIIHLRDWHFVRKEPFAASLRGSTADPLTDEEIAAAYDGLLDEVELVQLEQVAILRRLIGDHGLRRIHLEGLIDGDQRLFAIKVASLREAAQDIAELRAFDEPSIAEGIEELERQHRRDLLEVGAAGRLLLAGEIKEVVPLEDPAAFSAANPLDATGRVSFDPEKFAAREDAQVKRLLDGDRFALVILGAAHSLTDSIRRANQRCEYIRVTTARVQEFADKRAGAGPGN
jgi:hypothetical protein